MKRKIQELDDFLDFIKEKNIASILPEDNAEMIEKFGRKTFKFSDKEIRLLTDEEIENLSIKKGTLTNEERKEIESHVKHTYEILKDIPFPPELKNVPVYAAMHHEKLNGTGYPFGLRGGQIPLQGRILAIADIYDALVAKDRPYKKGLKPEAALNIISAMADMGEIDKDLFGIFVEEEIFQAKAEEPQYEFIKKIQAEKLPQIFQE